MNQITMVAAILFLFLSFGCGNIKLVPHNEVTEMTKQEIEQQETNMSQVLWNPECEECLVVPKSGANRDLRTGYYFDQKEMMCKEILYSTGAGCVPPPFKTLQQCISCCGR